MKLHSKLTALLLALTISLTSCAMPPEEIAPASVYSLDLFDSLPDGYSDASPFMWRVVDGQGDSLYLLGSIHAADRELYRLPQCYADAFLSCDALAVECDTLAYSETAERLSSLLDRVTLEGLYSLFTDGRDYLDQLSDSARFVYADGTDISDHIGDEMYRRLLSVLAQHAGELEKNGYSLESIKRYKPAVWSSLLNSIAAEEAGLSPDYGVDVHFLKIAKTIGKPVYELESVSQQFDLFNSFSDRMYMYILSAYADNTMEECAQSLRYSYGLWRSGSLEDFTAYCAAFSFKDEYDMKLGAEYRRVMITDRSAAMADRAEAYLAENGLSVFMIAGAAHMVGSDGIVELLRQRGYTVERIK